MKTLSGEGRQGKKMGFLQYLWYKVFSIVFTVLPMTFILTGSMATKDLLHSKETLALGEKNAKVIYSFTNSEITGEDFDKILLRNVCYSPDLNADQKAAYIKDYLQEQGLYKEIPDGRTFCQDMPLAEYYIDASAEKIAFVFHIWRDFPIKIDDETSEPAYQFTDEIYCTTFFWDDARPVGSIKEEFNQEQNIYYERLYDTNGKQTANISYQYIGNLPIPFIIECKELKAEESSENFLFRNQKFQLFEKSADFDDSGRLVSYNGNLFGPKDLKLSSYLSFYNKEGYLEKLERVTNPSDFESELDEEINSERNEEIRGRNYSSILNLKYQNSGLLYKANYDHSVWLSGTTSGNYGTIYYDDKGRMVNDGYLVTHGEHFNIYVYNGEEKNPWACFSLCSRSYDDLDQEGASYGNDCSGYFFLSDEEMKKITLPER